MKNEYLLSEIVEPLLQWFVENKRILPWRENPTPYRVWVSEIMLQQTRVEAVKPYYERFMKELPDVEALAFAEDEKLLKLWEGLGYYSRVRNLKKAAVMVMNDYHGKIPENYEELNQLCGIGSYTAGAISSIACGKSEPAVDGNVLRVVMRVMADSAEITKASVKKEVENALRRIMPGKRSGDFNQALMELGAMICVPNGEPDCNSCPIQQLCIAKQQGNMMEFPCKEPKKKRSIEEKTILIIQDNQRTALQKRSEKGLLAGMYEFPMQNGSLSQDEALLVVKSYHLNPLRIRELETSKHIFTHKEWHMRAYAVKIEEITDSDLIFADKEEVERKYPIPSAFAAYTKYLNIKIGNEKFS